MKDCNTRELKRQAGYRPYEVRLQRFEKEGKEYRATCPFHMEETGRPDNNPSLSVYQKGGEWLYYCLSSQSKGGDVIEFVQKMDDIDFKEAMKRISSESGIMIEDEGSSLSYDRNKAAAALQSDKRALEYLKSRGIYPRFAEEWGLGLFDYPGLGATLAMPYDDGVVKFRAVTIGANGNKFRHLTNGSSSDRLYGIGSLTGLDADVYVVESELDCLMMRTHGFAAVSVSSATTCLTGGELRLRHDHLELLKACDRRIFIVTDMDDSGTKCAMAFLKALPSHQVFRISWKYGGKDSTDNKDIGEVYEEIRKECEARAKADAGINVWDEANTTFKQRILCLRDMAMVEGQTPKLLRIAQKPSELTTEPVEWVIDGVYPKGCLSIGAGREGIGKGNHALLSIAAILEGKEFLGCRTNPVPLIIYVDLENPEAVMRDRLRRLGLIETDRLWIWGQWRETPPPTKIDDPLYLEAADRTGALFYFDSLIDFSEGANENDASEISAVMHKARSLARRCAGVIIQHHADKYGRSGWRGNTAIPAAADMAWGLKENDRHNLEFSTIKAKMTRKVSIEFNVSYRDDKLSCTVVGNSRVGEQHVVSLGSQPIDIAMNIVRAEGGIQTTQLKKKLQGLPRPIKFTKRQAEGMISLLRTHCRTEIGARNSTRFWIKDESPQLPEMTTPQNEFVVSPESQANLLTGDTNNSHHSPFVN